MNIIKAYFKWAGSLSAYKVLVLVLLLSILFSVWFIYVKG